MKQRGAIRVEQGLVPCCKETNIVGDYVGEMTYVGKITLGLGGHAQVLKLCLDAANLMGASGELREERDTGSILGAM